MKNTNTFTPLNQHQVESLQSLNRQINGFNIPNTEPLLIDHAIDVHVNCEDKCNHTNVKDNTDLALYSQRNINIEFGTENLDNLHDVIISHIIKIDFNSYIDKIGGDHTTYIKNGKSNIPSKIIAVVANDCLFKLITKIGYSISQLYSNNIEVKAAYLFNGKYWLPITESFIKKLLREALDKMGYDPVESKTSGLSDLLIRTFWNLAPKSPQPDNQQILINLNNSTLEIAANGEIKQSKFNKNDFMLYCLSYNYMPASACPLFKKYIDRVVPDQESQTVLQELLGSIFIKNRSYALTTGTKV